MKGFILSIIFLISVSANSAEDPLCSGVPPGKEFLFPYPYDCTKFYACIGGEKFLQNCEDGLWFNSALQACDHPENSGCNPNVPLCTNGETDYYPYPQDCSYYIECHDGYMEVHQCPDGLWFNANKKQCQTPAESGCTVTTEVSPTWTTPIEACWGVRPSQTILRPYPGDCNRFIECYGAQSTVLVCPPHLYFNEVRQLCDWPSESGCDDTTRIPDPSTTTDINPPTTPDGDDDPRCVNGTTSYWPHPECTKYIECYQGQGYTMECPSGLYFDPEDIMCEDPSQSSCGHTEPTIGPTTTKDSNWTPDPICPWPSNERYLFPYPGDCTKFWECAEGERVAMDCPDNLWFNPILLVCDYPYQSGCIYG